jgi:O-methyltransferase involved in polyketide biosynthesis
MDSRPSLTAEAVCFMRAVDQLSAPEDRVIDDPYAQHFLTPIGALDGGALLSVPPLAWRTLPELATYIWARHRYMDDRLREALDPAHTVGS